MKQTLTISLLTEAQNGSFGKNEVQSMTRAEAVERMAKAIYFKACGTMKDYAKCKKEYIPFAEAALDAILGGKNG